MIDFGERPGFNQAFKKVVSLFEQPPLELLLDYLPGDP